MQLIKKVVFFNKDNNNITEDNNYNHNPENNMITDMPPVAPAHSISVPAIVKQVQVSEIVGYNLQLINNTGQPLYYRQNPGWCPRGLCGILFDKHIVPQENQGEILNNASKTFSITLAEDALDFGMGTPYAMASALTLSLISPAQAKLYSVNAMAPHFLVELDNNGSEEAFTYNLQNVLFSCFTQQQESYTISYTLTCLNEPTYAKK